MLTQFVQSCCGFLFFIHLLMWTGFTASAQNSPPLAQGQWFKIGITQTGVYKLSAAELQKNGIISAATNPQHIQLYGQGGGMLPQPNAAPRAQGLAENAIFISGETDGTFDSQDYLLFFAQGPDKYRFDPQSKNIQYEKNLYSDTVFYFITVGEARGKRMDQKANLSSLASPTLNTYTAYAALEEEKNSLLNSGRRWLGDQFSSNSTKAYELPLYKLSPNTTLRLHTAVVSAATSSSTFKVSANEAPVQDIPLPSIRDPKRDHYAEKGYLVEQNGSINTNSLKNLDQLRLALTYEGSNTGARAFLDYIFATATADLHYQNRTLIFRSLESLQYPHVRFELSGGAAKGMYLWDVSNPQDARIQAFKLEEDRLSFTTLSSSFREFVAFREADALTPVSIKKVANQYLRGDVSPELVILTHPCLLPEAERLARFREQHDGLAVKVVTTTQVYNEFSSGAQDITAIRDYMRFLYESGGRIRYLLLFGRGYFDYKQKTDKSFNLVPVYESYNFTDPIKSYASDDYYGFLEEHEGKWEENEGGNHSLEIGIGRLPVVNLAEARQVVDKLILYQTSPESLGSWRNTLVFIADDGDSNVHQRDAEKLSSIAESAWPSANISKIYLGAFQQEKVANGERSAQATKAVNEAIEKGAFIVNYTGHGSLDLLTNEYIITKAGIEKWKNKHKLPLMVTATCEFGQHDNNVRSGAESMLLNPVGGAIGLLTTARPVYSHTNFEINSAFYQQVFPAEGKQPERLGDIIRKTKNKGVPGSGVINRNFLLLGDPSMKLAYPSQQISLTQLTNEPEGTAADTLKAFANVKATGIIRNEAGEPDASFNGVLEAVVYEKPVVYETQEEATAKMQFSERNNVIFRGKASVKEGAFSFSFTVPKSIRYTAGEGKISLYAVTEDSLLDARGEYREFMIGGSKSTPPADHTPPSIQVFLNDSSFRNGETVGKENWLIAHFQDENGINITNTGVHEGIVANLNGKTTFLLNDYYSATTDRKQEGSLRYPLQGLPAGEHRLSLTARDTYNNLAKTEIRFRVSEQGEFEIYQLFNYPNPFREQTSFVVEHSRAGDPLEAMLQIFNLEGRVVHTQTYHLESSQRSISLPAWDGNSSGGQKMPQGMYLFKIMLRSLTDGSTTEKTEKLVILN